MQLILRKVIYIPWKHFVPQLETAWHPSRARKADSEAVSTNIFGFCKHFTKTAVISLTLKHEYLQLLFIFPFKYVSNAGKVKLIQARQKISKFTAFATKAV